jgi:hypothetical protein
MWGRGEIIGFARSDFCLCGGWGSINPRGSLLKGGLLLHRSLLIALSFPTVSLGPIGLFTPRAIRRKCESVAPDARRSRRRAQRYDVTPDAQRSRRRKCESVAPDAQRSRRRKCESVAPDAQRSRRRKCESVATAWQKSAGHRAPHGVPGDGRSDATLKPICCNVPQSGCNVPLSLGHLRRSTTGTNHSIRPLCRRRRE